MLTKPGDTSAQQPAKPEPRRLALAFLKTRTVLRIVAATEDADPSITLENIKTGEQYRRWASDSRVFRHLLSEYMERKGLTNPVGIELIVVEDHRTKMPRLEINR